MARFGTRAFAAAAVTALAVVLPGGVAQAAPAAAPESIGMQATWSCSGIPAGYVSLQIDPYRCGGNYPGHLVAAPQSGQWICGWNGDALTGFVIDQTNPMSGQCHFNTSWRIVRV
ncbi:hypothetical protein RM572_15315 [Streptomyces sp. DSM 42041]|uniref:Secreted protein n=1 Tax=Streptomyces hazeniae TaxID=3075538 RepID=A0ABU2NT23_9ACTN|nr:hypothetical protein [Streptomyces sp. DSM 42041]MDT0380129.1 hypothetical protein [Streptomyces sp. DSM 42041]